MGKQNKATSQTATATVAQQTSAKVRAPRVSVASRIVDAIRGSVAGVQIHEVLSYDDFTKGKRTKDSDAVGLLRPAGVYATDRIFAFDSEGVPSELQFETRPKTQVAIYELQPQLADQRVVILRNLETGSESRTKIMDLPIGYHAQLTA
jgi:hypothetical protein